MSTGHFIPAAPLALLAGTLVVAVSGCGSGKPELSPVHGKVTYKGTALPCGTIVFTPDASRGHRGGLARSEIQADGSYSLRTDSGYGAIPGWYRVTVMAVEMPGSAEPGQRYPVPRALLPEKYRDPELAGLVREVKAGGENVIDFPLD
jgi:hypothetical protein